VPTIEFCASEFGPSVTVELPDGGALVDVCDEARAPVPFSCRSASCGTCRVEVLAGASLLEPPAADELEILDIFDSTTTHRLACQAKVRAGAGLVTLRSAED
jgi:ferredoxin